MFHEEEEEEGGKSPEENLNNSISPKYEERTEDANVMEVCPTFGFSQRCSERFNTFL